MCALHTGLVLLKELHLFFSSSDEGPTGQLTMYTDSASSIRKLLKFKEYPSAIHRAVLGSDWDVLQALHNTLLSLQTYPSINHVRSHQDDAKPVEELPLSAQLNVQADAMATEGLRWACPTPHVTFDPTSQVMLAVAGDSCTSDIKPLVRASHHFNPLMEYYKERFQWSEQTISSIDWDLFGTAYKRQCNKHHHFTHKFCMRKLPLGARLHKMDPQSQTCQW